MPDSHDDRAARLNPETPSVLLAWSPDPDEGRGTVGELTAISGCWTGNF
jgi:hypothetical protein